MSTAIDDLAASLEKAIGKNDKIQEVSNWIDSGYPPLNEILSGDPINGGFPFGRIVEIYGPSSSGKTVLATLMMINAQQQGGVAMFLDHEGTFEVGKAVAMGLKTDFPYWIYKRPDTWEESNTWAMMAADRIRASKAIKPDAPIICVFDSVASMIPKSVFEKGIDELTMNDTTALSRVTSTTLKSVNQFTGKMNATMCYLNQVRTKIGIVFGDPTCLRGDTVIPFVDGTTATIQDIVDGKISKEVWSLNEETGQLEGKKIIDWHDNGALPDGEEWIFINTDAIQTRNGQIGLTVTADHKVMTADGWVKAGNLKEGDKLASKIESRINGTLKEFVEGVITGDCSLKAMGKSRTTANLKIQDNSDLDYAKWKVEKLSSHIRFTEVAVKTGEDKYGVRYDSEFLNEFHAMMPLARDPLITLRDLTPIKLALWVMDDGYMDNDRLRYTISLKRRKNTDYMDALADMLFEKHGLRSRVRAREGSLIFDSESSQKIAQIIHSYVPDCMSRKLPAALRGKYAEFTLNSKKEVSQTFVTIKKIRKGSQHRNYGRYDVTVEDNHNYLVGNKQNGVIVHNCTPGGGAMEFYASIRLSLGRKRVMEELDGDKQMVGQVITIKTVKNKTHRPFQEVDLRLNFNEEGGMEFDFVQSMVDYLLEKNLLNYTKPYVTWIDGKKYHARSLIKHIKENKQEEELKKIYLSKK